MKVFYEIVVQEPVYLGSWDTSHDVFRDFGLDKYDCSILFAYYDKNSISDGEAWVLIEKDDKLWEINGHNDSFCGLIGQWNPEEVILRELHRRLDTGWFGKDECTGNLFNEQLKRFLGIE